jgi:hypothetical protein
LFTSKRQKSTSYFPYIMYNTKKIRTYRDVQYGKKYGFRLYNTGKILYGHIPKGDFFGPFKRFLTVLVRLKDFSTFFIHDLVDHGYVPIVVNTSRSFPRSLVIYVCFVDRCLSFCTFSFGHCVVCSSSMYGFWLPLWYLQTPLNTGLIVYSFIS